MEALYEPCHCSKERGQAKGETGEINPVGSQSIEQGERPKEASLRERNPVRFLHPVTSLYKCF